MYNYDVDKIKEILKDFYLLTGIKTSFYDRDENEVCYYPDMYSVFCESLRKNKVEDEKCRQCDKRAFQECRRTGKPYTYVCHAGLFESLAPILYEGNVIGYIGLGQIKTTNNPAFIAPKSLDENATLELEKSYALLPTIEVEKLYSAISILALCTGYEYLKTHISLSQYGLEEKISKYVDGHLTDDLTVESLCKAFGISKNVLYALFKEAYSCSVAQFIKQKRLKKATKLLQTTDLPIAKVAEKCGIPDYNYFSKQFKKEFGISPKEYRKKG